MATVDQYAVVIRDLYLEVAKKLGVDLRMTEGADRVLAYASVATLTILVKALTDSGALTDAQLNTAVGQVRTAAASWPWETGAADPRPVSHVPTPAAPAGVTTPIVSTVTAVWAVREIVPTAVTSDAELRWLGGATLIS